MEHFGERLRKAQAPGCVVGKAPFRARGGGRGGRPFGELVGTGPAEQGNLDGRTTCPVSRPELQPLNPCGWKPCRQMLTHRQSQTTDALSEEHRN